MENETISIITKDMSNFLSDKQIKQVLVILDDYELIRRTNEYEKKKEKLENTNLIEKFISSKRLEGCSENTIQYYQDTIEKLILFLEKPIKNINTDDLRKYLTTYREENKCSLTTIDNMRRIYSSFFSWLEDEDYIVKSPARRIHKIKTAKIIKNVYSDENIEEMRDTCKDNIRNLAIIELLISTGMRVGELVKLNKNDINFEERSCIVFGKGNKQREVYFDAKAKIHLEEYLKCRIDSNEALFVSYKEPHQRLSISGIELIIRKIGKKCNIEKAYPHKFRRTLATKAIDKGMPIEQVQKLLGHVKIETTMHYAIVNQNNVKISHRKYIG